MLLVRTKKRIFLQDPKNIEKWRPGSRIKPVIAFFAICQLCYKRTQQTRNAKYLVLIMRAKPHTQDDYHPSLLHLLHLNLILFIVVVSTYGS